MPKKAMERNRLGAWAFLIGVIIAIIFGFVPATMAWLPWVLVIIGIIIGFLNIADVEVQPFLIAGVVFVIVASLGGTVFAPIKIAGVTFLSNILTNMLMLFVPATIIVALKSVFSIAQT